MTEESWDVPSPRLQKLATAKGAPQFRECSACHHRHAPGELCAYQVSPTAPAVCRCSQ